MCVCGGEYLHSYKERLLGSQAGRGVLLHQGQGAEAKLVDGLIGVQRGEVCVHLAVVLGDVEAVQVHVLAVEEGERRRDVSMNNESICRQCDESTEK